MGRVSLGVGLNTTRLGILFGLVELGVSVQLDRTFLTLSPGHGGSTLAFGVQLLKHRVPRRLIEVYIKDFGAGHFDAPVVDGVLNGNLNGRDQLGAVSLHFVQFHFADLGANDAGDGCGNGAIHVADTVNGAFRLDDPVKHAGFDLNQHVVGCNRILTGVGQLPFEDRNFMGHAVQKRHNKVDAGPKNRPKTAEPLYHVFL